MTAKYCGLCRRVHQFQAVPASSASRRESWRDVALGVAVWLLLLAALGAFYLVEWTAVAP